jgi:hypothetical protein
MNPPHNIRQISEMRMEHHIVYSERERERVEYAQVRSGWHIIPSVAKPRCCSIAGHNLQTSCGQDHPPLDQLRLIATTTRYNHHSIKTPGRGKSLEQKNTYNKTNRGFTVNH